ncbi:MAG: FecR family protein [Candidatus Electryonea clarkiae]|nr:FecR family protein [Candidatus Electryonea clarkiae]MDP8285102.1 FecR family protein [Candidatus Electryonea clarkiae]
MKILKTLNNVIITLLLCAAFTVQVIAADNSPIAVALAVKGKVECKKGEDAWKPMAFGTTLFNGNQVRTGDDGFAALAFTDDNSQIKLRPNSSMEILGKRNKDFSITKKINLEIGELFASVKKQKGSLKIATPTAVASIKGTEVWVILDEEGNTRVLTLQGLVEFLSLATNESQQVIAGMIATMGIDGVVEIGGYTATQVPTSIEGEEGIHSVEIIFTDGNGDTKSAVIQLRAEESE